MLIFLQLFAILAWVIPILPGQDGLTLCGMCCGVGDLTDTESSTLLRTELAPTTVSERPTVVPGHIPHSPTRPHSILATPSSSPGKPILRPSQVPTPPSLIAPPRPLPHTVASTPLPKATGYDHATPHTVPEPIITPAIIHFPDNVPYTIVDPVILAALDTPVYTISLSTILTNVCLAATFLYLLCAWVSAFQSIRRAFCVSSFPCCPGTRAWIYNGNPDHSSLNPEPRQDQ